MTKNLFYLEEMIGDYVVFLLSGYTIEIAKKACLDDAKVKVGTINGYLRAVNKYYKDSGYPEPWNPNDEDAHTNRLLTAQQSFEKQPDRRSPLHPYVIAKLCELAQEDGLGFKACVWDFTGVGRFGGFRLQEFAMDSKHTIKYYILPDGTAVVRCFTNKNFIARGEHRERISKPLFNRKAVKQLGTQFEVQKNRMNGQEIDHARLPATFAAYCPVELGLKILARADYLGYDRPDDPLCVYKDKDGTTCYLTGEDITAYYRLVTMMVLPNTSDAELKLISTHSLRVTACVLLHEAGKGDSYIKLRLRWKSDCFEIYLRNTNAITVQHAMALEESHQRMVDLAQEAAGFTNVVDISIEEGTTDTEGTLNLDMDELEDED